jgi:hypothetical protein
MLARRLSPVGSLCDSGTAEIPSRPKNAGSGAERGRLVWAASRNEPGHHLQPRTLLSGAFSWPLPADATAHLVTTDTGARPRSCRTPAIASPTARTAQAKRTAAVSCPRALPLIATAPWPPILFGLAPYRRCCWLLNLGRVRLAAFFLASSAPPR